ncbi:MAG: tRNA (N(6)-L-threonylcarbamoyladenosine(37)-C(2))-methylthiotransferase MtaB [Clostridia bacterium]|nr:tRNA (N(6)-L-threonylcarbamoyladenosine(37)-C(2))-methylthiotransferase MtaB [Clostridia bacterium]
MTVSFLTLGCKVNQYESEALSELLAPYGIMTVPFGERCDAVVINTCAVTTEGERKARQMVRRAIAKNPDAFIAVTGCAVQLHPESFQTIKGVSFLCGNGNKTAVVEALLAYRNGKAFSECPQSSFILDRFEPMTVTKSERTRAYIKIEDGCDSRCAYCIIKKARGAVRSKPIAEVIAEAKGLIAAGYREIVLTGIETSDYGKDIGCDLVTLLEALDSLEGIGRIRLGSLDPAMFRDSTIDRLQKLTHLCRHFHLSMQSGCSKTLAAMRRRSSAEMIKERMGKLRKAMPDVTFTADIIVGFPGETDEDFALTERFLSEASLLDFHIFAFSPRPGTEAALMPDQISSEVKAAREQRLETLRRASTDAILDGYIGKILTVLIEEEKDGFSSGHTENFLPVATERFDHCHNTLINVLITDRKDGRLLGKRLPAAEYDE